MKYNCSGGSSNAKGMFVAKLVASPESSFVTRAKTSTMELLKICCNNGVCVYIIPCAYFQINLYRRFVL